MIEFAQQHYPNEINRLSEILNHVQPFNKSFYIRGVRPVRLAKGGELKWWFNLYHQQRRSVVARYPGALMYSANDITMKLLEAYREHDRALRLPVIEDKEID